MKIPQFSGTFSVLIDSTIKEETRTAVKNRIAEFVDKQPTDFNKEIYVPLGSKESSDYPDSFQIRCCDTFDDTLKTALLAINTLYPNIFEKVSYPTGTEEILIQKEAR